MAAMESNSVIGTEMEHVTPLVEDFYEIDDTFFSGIDKDANAIPVSERDMRVPLKLRPGGYFGQFNSNGGGLGRGSGTTYDKAVVDTVNLRYACEWTKKAEWGTDSARKAVVNAFQKLVADAMPQFRSDSDKLCMQAGTGVLGTVSAVSTASGVDTVTLNSDGFGAMLLRFGLKINVYDATLATNRTAAGETEITFYDPINKIVKLTPAVTGIVATDVIVLSGLSGANPVTLKGVPYHNSNASTGTWLGLSRVTNPEIRSTGINAAGAFQPPQARLLVNKMMNRIGMSKVKKLPLKAWMNPAQKDAYEQAAQLISIIQKQPREENVDLYFGDGMQMAGAPVMTSVHWDMTRIDFLIESFWGRAEMHPAGFYEVGGRKFFETRDPSGGVATSQLFYITATWNLFCKNPAMAGYIYGLTTPTGY
jgi:hypothetical protein